MTMNLGKGSDPEREDVRQLRRLVIEGAIKLLRTLAWARTSGDSPFPPASRGHTGVPMIHHQLIVSTYRPFSGSKSTR